MSVSPFKVENSGGSGPKMKGNLGPTKTAGMFMNSSNDKEK